MKSEEIRQKIQDTVVDAVNFDGRIVTVMRLVDAFADSRLEEVEKIIESRSGRKNFLSDYEQGIQDFANEALDEVRSLKSKPSGDSQARDKGKG